MSRNYRCVKFVNLSMSSLGVFSDECSTFLDMMNDIGIDKKQQLYIIKKMINIAISYATLIFILYLDIAPPTEPVCLFALFAPVLVIC